jgi:hypothetical protein
VMRGHLEQHVEKNVGKGALEELKMNNRDISILLQFRSSAEEEIAASRLLPSPPPETRTGRAPIGDFRRMATDTRAKNPELAAEMTGELYGQVGTENARKLATLDQKAELMSRLEDPLTHIAERGTTASTTLRSHGEGVRGYLERGGIGGGLALMATGHAKEGSAVVAATLASKYGLRPIRAAERGIAAMVEASRRGANAGQLRTLAKMARIPGQMAEDAVSMLAPREAATRGSAEVSDGNE